MMLHHAGRCDLTDACRPQPNVFSNEHGNGKTPVAVKTYEFGCGVVNVYDFGNLDGVGHRKRSKPQPRRTESAPPTEGESKMNLWIVRLPGKCQRYAASQADAKVFRDAFIEEYGVKKKEVVVEPCDVPTRKQELLEYLNLMQATIDAAGVNG